MLKERDENQSRTSFGVYARLHQRLRVVAYRLIHLFSSKFHAYGSTTVVKCRVMTRHEFPI
jgi:hypothetical protein